MQDPRQNPHCSGIKLIERSRYEWRGATGYLEKYVYAEGGRHFLVNRCDITHELGSTNARQSGWDQPQEIDSHRYARAMSEPMLGLPPDGAV